MQIVLSSNGHPVTTFETTDLFMSDLPFVPASDFSRQDAIID